MTAETLTTRQLNRALLARQLLLERSALAIPAALDQLCGIQNQYAPNAYIRLWSCLEGFRRDDLTRAYESGEVVQGTLMRGTIHTVSAGEYHPLLAAIREPMQAWARRIHRADDGDRQKLVELVRSHLRGRPALKRNEFLELLADAGPVLKQTIHTDAEVIRVPPSGTWQRRRADLFGLADHAIGHHEEVEAEAGRKHLIRRYLGGFGPAAAGDIATFCGIPLTMLKPTIDRMELREFRDEAGTTLLDLSDAPLPPADTPAPVRFLPTWDAILLVHARRTAVLAEQYRPILFNSKVPPSFATFMVDGAVAGTWRWDAGADRVVLAPFEPLPKRVTAELEEEAVGLATMHR